MTDGRTFTAKLIVADKSGGRVTLESGPHPTLEDAISGLAELAVRLGVDREGGEDGA